MSKWQPRVGQTVRVLSGPFTGFLGDVEAVDNLASTVKVAVYIYGRTVPSDLRLEQVELKKNSN